MGVPSTTPPPAGSVAVGQLRADAQTKTMWLGVAASIDPAQSILVGDIIGLQQADTDTLNSAKSYTDTKVATKANTVHTHAIADVTGLQAALDANAASLPSGAIVIWSGSLGAIPGGWHLCDGTFGTPDLRDRFVMGAGGTSAGPTGGSKNRSIVSDTQGGVTPTGSISSTILTLANLPAHNHTINDPGHAHSYSDPGHAHGVPQSLVANAGTWAGGSFVFGFGTLNTTTVGVGITIAGATTGITTANAGSGTGHTHTLTMNPIGGHSHTVAFDVIPPYILLGYIMKV